MHLALRSKKKLEFIDGTIPILEADPYKEEEWWEINTLINSCILNTIEPSLWYSVNYSKQEDELWADLKKRFLVGNEPGKYELKEALANCKQEGDLVNIYYSRLWKIWDGLQNYLQLPVSSTTTIIIKEREEEQVYRFLMGLNDAYNTVRSHIIQEEPLPKVKSIFARVCKKEQHCQLSRVASKEIGGVVTGGAFAAVTCYTFCFPKIDLCTLP